MTNRLANILVVVSVLMSGLTGVFRPPEHRIFIKVQTKPRLLWNRDVPIYDPKRFPKDWSVIPDRDRFDVVFLGVRHVFTAGDPVQVCGR